MTKKIRILESSTFDPAFNLATEDYIFRDMDPEIPVLFLWRNDKTVVIGRFQNPWTECHTQKMEEDKVVLVRRQSGGGAVYHDLGNTNFTFMSAKESYDKEANSKIIINALQRFGFVAHRSGRNDIVIATDEGERKISGSAFKETKDRCFHHGTLLISADLTRLVNYLNPHQKKLVSKGIQSVRSRVCNLSDINSKVSHNSLCEIIIEEFKKFHGLPINAEIPIEKLNRDELEKNPKMMEYYSKYNDWNWRFGETPEFTHQMTERFNWGLVEVHLNVQKALITDCKIFSDALHPEMIEELMASLLKISYTKASVRDALELKAQQFSMYSENILEFSHWLQQEIS